MVAMGVGVFEETVDGRASMMPFILRSLLSTLILEAAASLSDVF